MFTDGKMGLYGEVAGGYSYRHVHKIPSFPGYEDLVNEPGQYHEITFIPLTKEVVERCAESGRLSERHLELLRLLATDPLSPAVDDGLEIPE